jgi:CheY-like chemotaxis protein
VRNQLSVVLGLSYVLMQQKEIYNRLPKRILETINVLHRNGGFITNLLNTVLEISMADAGRPQLIKQEIIKVSLWLDELIQIWNPVAQGKGVSFTVEQDITLPSYLLIDKMHVMQILNNLIGNAIKFSPPGKGVLLRLKRIDDAYWNLSVVDQGIGIDSFDRKRIFLPYEQADGTIQQKFGGTGLGLSTSRRLAELMNGTLLLHESPGGGCDFTVTLPMNKPKSRKELHHIYTDGTLIDSAKGKNILIIEDVEQPSLIWETYLVKMGMQAHVIHQIKDLDISFNLYQPDLVIIDLDMPKLAGFDAFQKVKHYVMQQHIPIMALSANGFEDHKQAVVKHGFHSLLVKPVSYYDLINEFNRLFYKQSLNEIQETMYLNAQV